MERALLDAEHLQQMLVDLVWAIDHFTRENDEQAIEARHILKAARDCVETWHRQRRA